MRKRDLQTSKLAPTERDKHEARHVNYRLVAVIAHTGGAFGGHYTIFRRLLEHVPVFNYEQLIEDWAASASTASSAPSQWVHISDDSYRPVAESTVLQSEAYMLFYERE